MKLSFLALVIVFFRNLKLKQEDTVLYQVVEYVEGDVTMWLNVTTWEKQAEAFEKHAAKGTLVYVQGKLQMKKYKDKTSQAERLSVEISVSNVQLLEKRQKEGDELPDSVLPEV